MKQQGFKSITVRMRWIDYVRMKAVFPAYEDESAFSYFRRMALFLKKYPSPIYFSKEIK